MTQPLDSFDQKILTLVQRDCSATAEAIAESVGLSTSAVQKRLKQLRTEKIIVAEVALVDHDAVGRPVTFIVAMEIERNNYDALASFKEWAKQVDAIQQIYNVTGDTDLVVIITAKDIMAYDRLMARLMKSNPMIRRVTTNVVLSTLKTGLFVPVGEEGDGSAAS